MPDLIPNKYKAINGANSLTDALMGIGVKAPSLLVNQQIPREQRILNDVLSSYPALKNVYNQNNTKVQLADKNRMAMLSKIGANNRGMETWFPDDEGDKSFPNPNYGKYTFEYYDQKNFNNDNTLKTSMFLDALHGMSNDKKWQSLKKDFNDNWLPSERSFLENKHKKEANNGEDFNSYMNRTATDAYLRGALNPMSDNDLQSSGYNDEYAKLYRGQIKENGKPIQAYSDKQKQVIELMNSYLKSGK